MEFWNFALIPVKSFTFCLIFHLAFTALSVYDSIGYDGKVKGEGSFARKV